ncbi:BrnA antitoxin family protein [Pseudomonas kribbensis]|uniref:BrnA antitoxin family protein n=1 Tax=Pseudomonas kribbensis TaxID=1628086 RepID=UPI001F1CA648|nr:BrnA antitoxin family protein [Pseudomonas kribbensis]UIN53048.1 BrnA antitoxin family protein [Pseudomonas kribbensis]
MKDEYDFSQGKRGAIAPTKGKTRITIMLDDAVIEAAREVAESEGYGYQTVINNTLRRALLDSRGATEELEHSIGQFSATDLKSLAKKLSAAVNEIRRALEPEAKP